MALPVEVKHNKCGPSVGPEQYTVDERFDEKQVVECRV